MADITLIEVYRLPAGKTRAEFEEWYPRHIQDVLDTPLLSLVEADIQVGNDEYPRIVTIRTTEENLAQAQANPAIVRVLEDAAKWGAQVIPITPYEIPSFT